MEKIVIKVIVEDTELCPIDMGPGQTDPIYEGDVMFYSMGHVFNKEKSKAPYDYTIALTRRKTRKELGKDESEER